MYKKYVVNAIITARMTSTRLPGKVLLPLGKGDKPALQHIIERLRQSELIDQVIVATTTNETDEPIIDLCKKLECYYYRGSEDDVLTRVLECAKEYKTDIIVDVTGDCPLVNYRIADESIRHLANRYTDEGKKLDYCSNVVVRDLPRGLDVQVYWTSVLEKVNEEVDNLVDRQHVTSWIYKNPKNLTRFHVGAIRSDSDKSHIRAVLDTKEDYNFLQLIFQMADVYNKPFEFDDILELVERRYPELLEINKDVKQKNYYKELIAAYGM